MLHKAFKVNDNVVDVDLSEVPYKAQDLINLSLYIYYKIHTFYD